MHQSWHLLVFEMLGIIISYSWRSQRKQNRSVCLGQALIFQKTKKFNHYLPRCKSHLVFFLIRRSSFCWAWVKCNGQWGRCQPKSISAFALHLFSLLSALIHGGNHCVNFTSLLSFLFNSG